MASRSDREYRLPDLKTASISCVWRIASSGFDLRISRSATFPRSTLPSVADSPLHRAAFIVAMRSASAGLSPALTSSASSSWIDQPGMTCTLLAPQSVPRIISSPALCAASVASFKCLRPIPSSSNARPCGGVRNPSFGVPGIPDAGEDESLPRIPFVVPATVLRHVRKHRKRRSYPELFFRHPAINDLALFVVLHGQEPGAKLDPIHCQWGVPPPVAFACKPVVLVPVRRRKILC